MDLKGLVHRELGEGLTEEELASAVGVSVRDDCQHSGRRGPIRSENLGTICAIFSHSC